MHLNNYFGDSYDIVKQSLIRWLAPLGEWSAHPMFTETVQPEHATSFERFLGVRLLSNDVLCADTNRYAYFACAAQSGNLFLDPRAVLFAEMENRILGGIITIGWQENGKPVELKVNEKAFDEHDGFLAARVGG